MSRPWWRAYPKVWVSEAAALKRIDPHARVTDRNARGGPVRMVDLTWQPPGYPTPVRLRIRYPSGYPWFAPAVSTPDLRELTHHRSPTGALCLLAREDEWNPGITAARLIRRQLPLLVRAGSPGVDTNKPILEAHVPESVVTRFTYDEGAVFRYRQAWPEAQRGRLLYRNAGSVARAGSPVHILAALDGPVMPDVLQLDTTLRDEKLRASARLGVWLRLARAPSPRWTPERQWELAMPRLPEQLRTLLLAGDSGLLILVFPDETRYRGKGEGAIALVRISDPEPVEGDHATGESQTSTVWRLRVQDRSPGTMYARVPHGRALLDEAVAVVGAGAIGGPFTFELARSGVGRLALLDAQDHRAEDVLRQLPPVSLSGVNKASAVLALIEDRFPHVTTVGGPFLVGAHNPHSHNQLREVIGVSALVCDATANEAVTRFLSAHARAAGVPLLVLTATNGAYGGVVTLLEPDPATPCWGCVDLHRRDGTVPIPPELPFASTPIGCSAPSFLGTAAELSAVWSQAVRVAVDRLLEGDARHGFGANYFVLRQRDEQGKLLPANWTSLTLHVHPGCPRHPPTSRGKDSADAVDVGTLAAASK